MPKKESEQPSSAATANRPPREWMWPFFVMVLVALGVLGYWGTSIFAPRAETIPTLAPTAVAAVNSPTPARVGLNANSAATNTPVRQVAALPTVPQPTAVEVVVPPVMAADYQLTILHTNDVQGYLDPCG
jgi:hypothetical protein